jgi:hypothetical protein
VSHTGLVTHEGGQVDGLGLVILGEGLNATTVGSATLAIKLKQNKKIQVRIWSLRSHKEIMDGKCYTPRKET